jgi:PAS domain S-box-containing protein
VAVLATAAALAMQALLIPLFGGGPNSTPFLVFFAAVMVSAWFGGFGPGLLSVGLSALLSWYFFLFPQYSVALHSPGQALRLLVFAGECVAISALAGTMHRARERAEAGARKLLSGETQLQARARQQAAVANLGRRALEDHNLQTLMEEAVTSVAEILGVEYAKVLELLPSGEMLLLRAGVGWDEGLVGRATVGAGSDSQAGYTLISEEPVVVEDLHSEARFTGPSLLREHGVVSGMSAVVRGRARPFGVLGAHAKGRRTFTEDDVYFLRAVANVLAAAIERERSEEAQRFLAETGALLSSSLDYRATLAKVARLAVPTLADWCGVDVVAEDGTVERLAVAHEDPEKVALAYELQERYPADPEAPGGLHKVLRTGSSEFYPEVTDAMLEASARDAEHLKLLREIGFTSVIIVPMTARGRTLGAVTLVSAESGRRFGESDMSLAEELARRAATAVDNAGLYEEARREIAERRRAQAELRASRDQLEVVLRGVADGVTAQDASGDLVYANEVAARIAGYPSVQAMVKTPTRERIDALEIADELGQPFPPDRLPGRRALRGEEDAEEVLRFRVLGTGEERWTIAKAAPVFDERGEVLMAVSIFRDITESRRAEEAMRGVREAERTRMARDLHDGVLQDLSYTAAAMGVMMLEAEGTKLEGQLQGAIDAVRRAARGLRNAVHDLRIEEELDRPFPELVESLVRRNRSMARGYEIGLEVEPDFPRYPLGETGTQLWRVLQEALTNARRHSRANKVSVVLRTEGEDLIAEISDDGRGFGPEAAPGVGQTSMRERAAAVGGELRIESEPGRGTTVRLRAPLPRKAGR